MDDALRKKIGQLDSALSDLKNSLAIDLKNYSDTIVIDTLKNGQIQKFEMSMELLWKTMKKYLLEMNGLDLMSPKTVIKSWFENKYCSYEEYESLMDLVDKRNSLSHLYNSVEYLRIHSSLGPAWEVMYKQAQIMNP